MFSEIRVSWPAIFAGAFIAVAIQLLFVLLGTAIGLSVFDPEQGDQITLGATITFGIYLLVTMLISFFAGGFATSRLGAIRLRPIALLHGLAVWGLVTAFLTYSFGSPMSGLLGGVELLMDPTLMLPPEEPYPEGLFPESPPGQAPGQVPGQIAPLDPEEVTNAAATTTWLSFLGVLLSGLGAALGGLVGASVSPPEASDESAHPKQRAA